MADRELKVKIGIDLSGLKGDAAAAGREFSGIAKAAEKSGEDAAKAATKTGEASKKAAQDSQEKWLSAGKIIGAALVIATGLATSAVLGLGMTYEKSLNTLQAVSSASAAEMGKVSEAAKALGNDIALPGASAGDAAAAMTELAKGGLTLSESMGAAKGTLQLAAAAQIDGAQAATIQSAALNTFGLAAEDAGRVADVLANAANASSGEITDFAQGMAQSGLAAKAMGISLEDTATTLALFANNGLSGSDAGTSLKTMLVSLTSPSKEAAAALETLGVKAFDSSGQFVGMKAITEQLTAAQQSMTTEQFNAAASTAFGTDAMRAAIAMAESGPDGYDAMSEAIGRAGGAADLAAANSKGLAGAVDLVRNAAETAALGLYEQLSPALDEATRGVADMIPTVATALIPALETAGTAVIGLVDAVAPLIPAMGEALASAVSGAAAAIAALLPIVIPLIDALGWTLSVISDLPTPVLAAAAAFGVLTLTAPFGAMVTAIGGMITSARAAGGALAALKAAALGALSNPVILAAAAVAAGIGLLVWANQDAEAATVDLTGAIDDQTGAFTDNARASLAKSLQEDGTLDKIRGLGIAQGDYTDALLGNVDAQDRVGKILKDNLAAAAAVGSGIDANTGEVVNNSDAYNDAVGILGSYNASLGKINEERTKGAAVAAETSSVMWSTEKADAYGASLAKIAEARDAMDDKPLQPLVTDAAALSLDAVSTALASTSDAASSADDALQFFNITVNAMQGINVSAEQATKTLNDQIRATQNAFEDASTATEGNTASLLNNEGGIDTTTEAGSKLYDSLQGMREGYDVATTAAYENTVGTQGTEAALKAAQIAAQGARDKFIENATAALGNRDAAVALADQLGLVEGVKLTDKNFALSATGLTATELGLQAVKAALDAIPTSRTININTVEFTTQGGVGATKARGGINVGGVEVMAQGGIIAAASGFMRRPMMAKGGSNILWAEAGDESYIPHDIGMRARANEIMAQTAAILGGQFIAASAMPVAALAEGMFPQRSIDTSSYSSATNHYNKSTVTGGNTYQVYVTNNANRPVTSSEIMRAIKDADRTARV